jgi:predicted nucleic acid-binding protein
MTDLRFVFDTNTLVSALRFLSALVREAKLVDVTDVINECRDPKDDKFLELAVSGDADYIVSGDKDLLELNPFQGIRILSPNELMDSLNDISY